MRSGSAQNNMNYYDNKYKKNKNEIKVKHVIFMIVWAIIAIFMIYQVYSLVMYTLGKKDRGDLWLYNSVNKVFKKENELEEIPGAEEHTLKLAGIGDIYETTSLLTASKLGNTYNFSKGTENLKEKLSSFDVVVGSLATPIADKTLGYSNKTTYNSPKELLDTLKELNITAVATATNHAMDKNEKGIIDTITNLKDSNIDQIGINDSNEKNKPLVISKNEIKIGFLSYATKSNIKLQKGKEYLVNIIDEEDVKSDIEYLKSQNVDYIISYLNVPNEDSLMTSGDMKKNTELLFNNGVNIVLGTGAMVVQNQVEDQIDLGNDKTSHVYAIYSLGDFFGKYVSEDNRACVIANIEFSKQIKKNKKGEITKTLTDFKVNTPIFVWTNLSKNNLKSMYIMEDEINKYNSGSSDLTVKEYNELVTANKKLKNLFDK